jgi:tetratricopeptide (TPR) repeat protein
MRFAWKHLLLSLMLLSAGVDAILSQTGNDWWEPMFRTGLSLLEQKQFAAAREQFEKILIRNKNIARAYYGLGLSYAIEKPDSREALDQFKKAIKIDENYAEAYYQSALVYINMKRFRDARGLLDTATRRDPKFVAAWLKLGEVEAERGESSQALEAYIQACKNNPDNEDLYNRLISSSIKFHEENKVIAYLEELAGSADNHELRSDVAYLYFASGDLDRSRSIVSTIPPEVANTRIYLLQANLHFENENNATGLAYYWSAVNSIKSEADAEAILRDCIYIMSNEEYARLLKTPLAEVWKFYYGFWRSHDPDLSTDENERIPEYYRRLSHARKSYRRTTKVDDLRFKLEHPLNDQFHPKVGSEMFAGFLVDALRKNRDLDDMGLIYVRHGQPDRTATALNPELPQNVSWKFDEKWNRPEMTFHFTKWGGGSGWILSSLPITFEDRWDLGGIYGRLDPKSPGYENLAYSDLAIYFEQVDFDAQAHARIAIQTETSDYRYAEIEPLEFPLHFATFRGE